MKKTILIILAILFIFLFAFNAAFKSIIFDIFGLNTTKQTSTLDKGKITHKVAILADSHLDYQRLKKSLDKAKKENVNFVLHLGDLSDFGGFTELKETKKILDDSNINYLVIPGDRDVVEGGNNFKDLFADKQCFNQLLKEYKILCFANPYNYTLLDKDYIDKFISYLPNAKIVVMSQPIYNPNSNLYMGYFSERVKNQADLVYKNILNFNIPYVVSGDTHYFKYYYDSLHNINYYNVGAVTDKRNLQSPNFSILTIYSSGFVEVNQKYID